MKKSLCLAFLTLLLLLTGCISTETTSLETTSLETTLSEDTINSVESTTVTNTTLTSLDLSDNQTLNWYVGMPITMSPINIEYDTPSGNIVNHTFEGLVNDIQGTIQPGIAESWDISSDGLTVTFHLRESYWSDGSRLTANDFVYSWNISLDSNPRYEWGYTNISKFEAIDDDTLVVHLSKPTASLLYLLALPLFMPINQSMNESSNGDFYHPDVFVCNGPFQLSIYDNSRIVLEKNDYYWNADNVYLNTIIIWTDLPLNIIIQVFNNGELNFASDLSNENVNTLEEAGLIVTRLPALGTSYISINLENQYLSNRNLRLALAYALDQEVMNESLKVINSPALGIIGSGFIDDTNMDFAKTVSEEFLTSNAELAEAYFETAATELGLTVEGLQNVLSQMSYKYTLSEYQVDIALMIEAFWEDVLGFKITLIRPDYPIYLNDKRTGEFDFIYDGWNSFYGDPEQILSIFMSDYIYNYTSYSNVLYDSFMESALNAVNAENHYENLYNAYEILLSDMPVIPIGHFLYSVLADDDVSNWTYSSTNIMDFTSAYIHS